MPHLKFKGIKLDELKEISAKLITDLVRITETPKDQFTFELIESTFVFDGVIGENKYPFVNVDWFYRGHEIMEEAAEKITGYIKEYDYTDVRIYFTNLIKENYFENGKHF